MPNDIKNRLSITRQVLDNELRSYDLDTAEGLQACAWKCLEGVDLV